LLFILSDSFLFLMMRLSTVAVTLLTICFLAAAATGSAASAQVTPPPRVRIGGFFAPVSPSGALYVSQAEHLAAFVMAARDINDKTDGIFDDVLVGTDFQIAVGIENSLSSAAVNAVQLGTAFGGQGVEVAVSALRNGNAPVVAQLLSSLNTLTVLSDTDSAVFNNFALYPYVANVRPLVSRQGMVIQNMICQSDVRKIVVFAGTDVDNIHMMSQFQDESICDLDILAVITIRADLNDMSLEIERAKAMGSRYFIQFLPAHQLASLIEQGYAANLFRDNTVMYTSSHSIVNITNHFSPDTDVAQVMTGLFYFKYIPNYYMERSSEGISFARRWREQPSRAGQVVNGLQVCDTTKDSTGANYLYQSTMKSNVTVCTGQTLRRMMSRAPTFIRTPPLPMTVRSMLLWPLTMPFATAWTTITPPLYWISWCPMSHSMVQRGRWISSRVTPCMATMAAVCAVRVPSTEHTTSIPRSTPMAVRTSW
jgi:hypothetical protein